MCAHDVVIVGGGPAGSACAWKLKQAGMDCLILDSRAFPRVKLCAGWITPAVFRCLESDPAEYPHSLLTLRKIRVEVFGKKSVRRWTVRTRQYSVRRCEFDHWLLLRSGAPFEEHEVRSIRREGRDYIVDDRYRCRNIVGAGGTHCPVRRAFFPERFPMPRDLQVAALEEEFCYPARDESCRLWFGENGLQGYSWFVPKGDGWVNVGLGAIRGGRRHGESSLRRHWAHLEKKLSDLGIVRGHDFRPGGYIYSLRQPGASVRRERCFLVGDSAGLATSNLGEGISPAIESGLIAARAIVSGGPYSLGSISRYSYLSTGWLTRMLEGLLYRGRDLLSMREAS